MGNTKEAWHLLRGKLSAEEELIDLEASAEVGTEIYAF